MTEAVLFGGGSFKYVQPALAALRGVTQAQEGYSGGITHYPCYEEICNRDTGHIEVVLVRYKPEVISFDTLLEVFFFIHDPTSLNKQGNEEGEQYASAIFYTTAEQHKEAAAYIDRLSRKLKKPVLTRLIRAEVFWPAEKEHESYYLYNSLHPYSLEVIQPKLRKLSKHYDAIIKRHEDLECS